MAIKRVELMKACCQPSSVSLQDLMSEIMIMWVISSTRHSSGAILITRVCVYVLYLHLYEAKLPRLNKRAIYLLKVTFKGGFTQM